jgi:hypothetical protein
MIKEPPSSFEFGDRPVNISRVVIQDDSLVLKRAQRALRHAIFHQIGHHIAPVGRVAEIIQTISFMDPNTFVVIFSDPTPGLVRPA